MKTDDCYQRDLENLAYFLGKSYFYQSSGKNEIEDIVEALPTEPQLHLDHRV